MPDITAAGIAALDWQLRWHFLLQEVAAWRACVLSERWLEVFA